MLQQETEVTSFPQLCQIFVCSQQTASQHVSCTNGQQILSDAVEMGYKITQIIMINNVAHRVRISLQTVYGSSNFCVKVVQGLQGVEVGWQ